MLVVVLCNLNDIVLLVKVNEDFRLVVYWFKVLDVYLMDVVGLILVVSSYKKEFFFVGWSFGYWFYFI